MTIKSFAFLLGLALVPAPALSYVSSDGHEYDATCNADGYVLTSLFPVARAVGHGAATHHIRGVETLYLGRSCDAYTKAFGHGQWCWANGGFVVEFTGLSVGFARQELYCAARESIGDNCRCE